MKRYLTILMILVLAVSVFVACDNSDKNSDDPTPTPTATSTPEPTEEPTPTAEPTPTPTPEPGTNVALNKPYEVSSETDSTYVQWGWSSEFINDGQIEQDSFHVGWTTNVKQFFELEEFEEQWVQIDLGGVIAIDKVVLYPRQDKAEAFPMDYFIEVSKDGKEYDKVVEVTDDNRSNNGDLSPAILTFDAVEARYVRLVVTKPHDVTSGNDGYLVQLAEFEIYSAPSSTEE